MKNSVEWREPPPAQPAYRTKVPRDEQERIADEYANGLLPMQAIADRYGISRERVRQYVARYYNPADVRKWRVERKVRLDRDSAVLYAEAVRRKAADLDPCRVCRGPNYRHADLLLRGKKGQRSNLTCSPACAQAWQTHHSAVLYRTDPKWRHAHRRRIALSILRHPKDKTPARIAWATKFMEADARGEELPRNRTFKKVSSRVTDPLVHAMLQDRGALP